MFSHKKKNRETRTRNVSNKSSHVEVGYVLRTVPRDEAFYFYEELGKPAGYIATSLADFCEKINAVRLSSLIFHLKRRDFENWVRGVIGDPELAGRIGKISPDAFDLKAKLHSTVNNRIMELEEVSSPSTVVSEDVLVTPRFPETELSK